MNGKINSGKEFVLAGDLLWNGIDRQSFAGKVILIEDGKIKAIGSEEEIIKFPQQSVIRFPGGTLMPGLIDSHTHLSMDSTLENYLDHMSDPVPVLTLRAAKMMRKDLEAGITTCRCCGDREFLDIACRQAVERSELPGPRLLVATRGIKAPGGHGYVGYSFAGPESIRRAIRENISAGTDFTKIYISGTLKGEGSLPSYLTRKEILASIEESHQAGIRLTAHCVGGEGLDWAVDAGIDSIEHAYHISDRQIERNPKAGTRIVLTPGPILSDERVNHLPSHLIQGHRKEKEMIKDRMEAVIQSGIAYAVGTDGLHGGLWEEVCYLTEMGATNHAALQAATLHGALVSGIEKETGSLEVGKDADILVIEGDPIKDIFALNKVLGVIKSGRLVYNDPLQMDSIIAGEPV